MNSRKFFSIVLLAMLIVAGFQLNALAQTATTEAKDQGLATMSAAGSSVRWDVKTSYSGATLTVAAPDGRVFRNELKAGATPEFTVIDKESNRLPDGHYTYELRLASVSKMSKEALLAERGKDDDPENIRSTRKRAILRDQSSVQSGSFSILNGAIVTAGAVEETQRRPTSKTSEQPRLSEVTRAAVTKLRQHHISAMLLPDDVIPDDLIVQGSACVGLDCVSGEVFSFDTIRLKENNTRIKFDDTSTAAGFPANDWQLTANDSASGGSSKFSIEDITGAKVPFTITAGAATNSVFVASTGKVGFRTATPVLDLHVTTSDTPAHRFEQTSAGGFTAQTWDIGANEANFFVRDVTGGSRLSFRIRPGAPTSSVDISANGNVGIGTASPELRIDARVANTTTDFTNNTTYASGFGNVSGKRVTIGYDETGQDIGIIQSVHTGVGFKNLALNPNSGNVGIGTTAPTNLLSVDGTAGNTAGGSWLVFSDERLKNIKGRFSTGLSAVLQLQPLRFEYKPNNGARIRLNGERVGFGAQSLQKVIPEAVTVNENGYLQVNNDPILWTMLNAIKEQQQQIEQLKTEVRRLRTASRRRR